MATSGCCCGEDCTIYSDDFATDTLSGSWSQVTGTWGIASGVLSPTANGDLIVSTTDATDDYIRVQATWNHAFTGCSPVAMLVADYVDVDNYHYAKFTLTDAGGGTGNMTAVVGKRTSGTDTDYAGGSSTVGRTWNHALPATIQLCIALNGSTVHIFGSLFVPGSTVQAEVSSTKASITLHGGTKAGIKLVTNCGGTSFDSFLYSYMPDADNVYACDDCNLACYSACVVGYDAPPAMFVDFGVTGITGGDCCADAECDFITGAFLVPREFGLCCNYFYFESGLCAYKRGGCNATLTQENDFRIAINCENQVVEGVIERRWRVRITYCWNGALGPECPTRCIYSQYYYSDWDADIEFCSKLDTPVTCTADPATGDPGVCDGAITTTCVGQLPETITVYV